MTEREMFNYKWLRDRIIYYTDVDVLDNRRTRENVNARVIFSKIAREQFWHTWGRIGQYLGKDHATVMHSAKGFEVLKMYEYKFYKAFQMILIELEGEEMIVRHHNLGIKNEIDQEVIDYRESIKNTIKELRVKNKIKELQNTI